MADKGVDLIKYMTERAVQYMDTPKEERMRKKQSSKAVKEPWMTRWFGWGSVGLLMWWKGR